MLARCLRIRRVQFAVASAGLLVAGTRGKAACDASREIEIGSDQGEISEDLSEYVQGLKEKRQMSAYPTTWSELVRRGLRGSWNDYMESLRTFHYEKCAIEAFSWATGCGILMAAHRFKESGGCLIRTRNWGFATYFGMLSVIWFTCRRQQINTAMGIRRFYEDKDSGAIEEAQMAARARLQRALRGAAMGADGIGSGARSLDGSAAPLTEEEERQLALARHEEEVAMWKRRRAEQQYAPGKDGGEQVAGEKG